MSILSSVALGWLGRRVLDWGGIAAGGIFGLIQFYNAMPPGVQEFVKQIAAGNWQNITLGALPGIALWAFSQWRSYKATVKPQVITPQGEQVEYKQMPPSAQQTVTTTATQAKRSMTVLDMLAEKLNRKD